MRFEGLKEIYHITRRVYLDACTSIKLKSGKMFMGSNEDGLCSGLPAFFS